MRALLLIPILCLSACATKPHVYVPPNPGKLQASTNRVSVAVTKAHAHAREAKTQVDEAAKIAKEVQTETSKIKDLPDSVVTGFTTLESKLNETQNVHQSLENDLREADSAKAQVEKDKTEYFAQAQGLADKASEERNKRIADEKKLSWYRWHWWGSWICLGLGLLAILVVGFLKFTGRLAIAGMKL